ncbi:MAG: hypothetical protein R3F33_11010 [Planctomycetota bacterium]
MRSQFAAAILVAATPCYSQTVTVQFPFDGSASTGYGPVVLPQVPHYDEDLALWFQSVGCITQISWDLDREITASGSAYNPPANWYDVRYIYSLSAEVVGWSIPYDSNISTIQSGGLGWSTTVVSPGQTVPFSTSYQSHFEGSYTPHLGWPGFLPNIGLTEIESDSNGFHVEMVGIGGSTLAIAATVLPNLSVNIELTGTVSIDLVMDMPATELCPGEGAHIAAAWSEETGIIVHGQEGFPPDQFAIVFRGSAYQPVPGSPLCIGGPGAQRLPYSAALGGIQYYLDPATVMPGETICLQAVHRISGGAIAFSNAVSIGAP